MFTQPFSPGGGYLRMPMAWLSLPVSPQAKFLLVAFCGFANAKGESYHSYEQLGELMGRSKAAISGYVKELRNAGVLDATPQTYGNGYNYRLLIRLQGWAEILRSWSKDRRAAPDESTPGSEMHDAKRSRSEAKPRSAKAFSLVTASSQSDERRVQPAEHKDPKGPINQIHQNKSALCAVSGWAKADEEEWRKHRNSDRDPVSVFNGRPRETLLQKLSSHLALLKDRSSIPDQAVVHERLTCLLKGFVSRHRLKADSAAIDALAAALAPRITCSSHVELAITRLEEAWKPHWRRLSSPAQALQSIGSFDAPADQHALLQEIALFSSRLWVAELHMKKPFLQKAA